MSSNFGKMGKSAMGGMKKWNRFIKSTTNIIIAGQRLQQSRARSLEVVAESLKIIESSKNWETKKSRIKVIILTVERMLERDPFSTEAKQLQAQLPDFKTRQLVIHLEAFRDKIKSCLSKAETLKTEKAKQNIYAKAYEIISQVEEEDPFVPEDEIEKLKTLVATQSGTKYIRRSPKTKPNPDRHLPAEKMQSVKFPPTQPAKKNVGCLSTLGAVLLISIALTVINALF